jgi:hypothetical protein
MGHRNANLSYIAASDIHMGRALELRSDGTVAEITDLRTTVIGWSMENVLAGHPVSVRSIFEGTIMCELGTGLTMYPGSFIRWNDSGIMVRCAEGAEACVANSIVDHGGTVDLTCTAASWTPDEWMHASVAVRGGAQTDQTFWAVGNTTDTITIEYSGSPTWTAGFPFLIRFPLCGFVLKRCITPGSTSKYAECLVTRQIARADRT